MDIVTTNQGIEVLTHYIMHMTLMTDKFIMKVNNNANLIRFLTLHIW